MMALKDESNHEIRTPLIDRSIKKQDSDWETDDDEEGGNNPIVNKHNIMSEGNILIETEIDDGKGNQYPTRELNRLIKIEGLENRREREESTLTRKTSKVGLLNEKGGTQSPL